MAENSCDTVGQCSPNRRFLGKCPRWSIWGDRRGVRMLWVLLDTYRAQEEGTTQRTPPRIEEGKVECVVEDFPMPGQATTLAWQQSSQNFVITDVE